MSRLTILLDVGGVINDKRQQTAQFQQLVGDYFAPLLGGTSEAWNEAHRVITERLVAQGEALAQAAPDFISFHRTYNHKWLGAMCELLGLPILPQEECIALGDGVPDTPDTSQGIPTRYTPTRQSRHFLVPGK